MFFCNDIEIVNQLFFHFPIIQPFWDKVILHHPQGRRLNISSSLNFWNSCLSFSLVDVKYWGILLMICIWVIWLERNNRVFNDVRGLNSHFFFTSQIFSYLSFEQMSQIT